MTSRRIFLKFLLFPLFLFIIYLSLNKIDIKSHKNRLTNKIIKINSEKLYKIIQNNNSKFIIIDIRNNKNEENIQYASMIPAERLISNFDKYKKLINKKHLILFNQNGQYSENFEKLAELINKPIYLLEGGLDEWKKNNFPILSKKRILITGGAGFIGSNLAERMQQDYIVTILDNLSTGKLSNIKDLNAKFIEGDIRDTYKVENLISQNDYVVHLAANVSVQKSIEEPTFSASVNIDGFVNILESCKKFNIKKLVFASSAAVYGDNKNLPLKETEDFQILSNYGLEKSVDEQYASLYKKYIDNVGLRFFNVYGKNQDPSSPYSGVISKFVDSFRDNKDITIFGDGLQSRDFIHVSDVCEAIMKSLNSDFTGVLNVCTNKSTNLLQLVNVLENIFHKKQKVHFAPAREGDIRHSLCNNKKAKDKINFEYTVNLNNGLRMTIGHID